MNGLLQQTKRAARGVRTVVNLIAIACLRMDKLKHLPANPLRAAVPPCRASPALRGMPPEVNFHTKRHRALVIRLA
jgi:hypothetical protein